VTGARPSIQQRVAAVKRKLPIAAVVERHVKLSGSAQSRNRRGRCPFHGSSSASFSIKSVGRCEDGFAHCFGCQWSGDVVAFTRDILGVDFMTALAECEREAGLADGGPFGDLTIGAGPVYRERNPGAARRHGAEPVDSLEMARWIWRQAYRYDAAARRYFGGRGIPMAALSGARLAPFRYLADCPCWAWKQGEDPRQAKGMLTAPAIMAMVREPQVIEGVLEFVPVGLHVTYLNPAGDGTMVRPKPWAKPNDEDRMLPKRRMLGPVGRGAIIMGEYSPMAHLYVGEGNETLLSAMALADAPAEAVGVATLSLDNLQGRPRMWKAGVLPLHAIAPDADRGPFVIPGHRGPVTGLVDSDMSPLRGPRDRQTGEFQGMALVERKGGPIVRRALTGAERAQICGELVVKGWRAALARSGSNAPVEALRAPAGMDFNDAVRREGVV
jgi:DNA primase